VVETRTPKLDAPTAAPAALAPLATALLRCAAPPAELLAAVGDPLTYSDQDALVRLLRSAPRSADAAYLQRLADAVAAQLDGAAHGDGDDDDDEYCVHDGLYELAQAARSGASDGGSGSGGHVTYWLHPALATALGGSPVAAVDACTLPPPLLSVWRSATFSDVSTGVWPAALTLAQAVGSAAYPHAAASDAPEDEAAASLHARWRALWTGRAVVELGAGTGLAGLALAALTERVRGSSARRNGVDGGDDAAGPGGLRLSSLCLTDGEAKSVALLARNAADNGFGAGGGDEGDAPAPALPSACRVTATQLDWVDACAAAGAPRPHPLAWPVHDAVIATDVVYDPAAVAPLVGTLVRLLRPPGAGGAFAASTPPQPSPSLAAALDALLAPTPPGMSAAADAASARRRPFALLANTRRNAATYALLEDCLAAACSNSNGSGGLAWADVTEPLLGPGGLSAGRPVLDLRLPTPAADAAAIAATAGSRRATVGPAVTDTLSLRNGASGSGSGGSGAEVRLVLVW
jgi:hypothetical protein